MKTNENGRLRVMIALAVIGLASLPAKAQLFSFDNSNSVAVARYDYGSATPTANHSVSWSSLDSTGNPASGSLQLSMKLSTSDGTSSSGAFTLDLFYPGQNFSSFSFDLYVAPNSATDAYHGGGYFEAITRLTDGYNSVSVYNQELGNPSYAPTNLYGTWQHIVVPLNSSNGTAVRALTFQDYDDSAGRNLNGTVTFNIDNIAFTPVPEPTFAALFGLGVAACCRPRRKH